jgi:biotin-dependent carboxylase-like uncharacterized protein
VIEVLDAGSLTTIQDLGRPGWAHIGVSRSGAADTRAFTLANRLVGNEESAPALETTVRGPVLRFLRDTLVALAGAPVEARAGPRSLTMHAPEWVHSGETLEIGAARTGVRTYIAMRGGIATERVLGSAATDLLSGLGPPPLRAGVTIRLGFAVRGWPAEGVAPIPGLPPEPRLRVALTPRADWFPDEAIQLFVSTPWEVSPDSNRVGVRLGGASLKRTHAEELRSEGVLSGAIQVPPSGAPILLLVDHPTTGGYPVLAVVLADDLPLAGQLAPGQTVRFALARC